MIDGQHENKFRRKPLVAHLESCKGKKLRELDVAGVFVKAIKHPGIKGIAGDVVEQSILGLKPNSRPEPDIEVDDVRYEVKTTGIFFNKKKGGYEAKEPMSITAVSPDSIVNENYYNSHFWHKVQHMLLFYYHYNTLKRVSAPEYAEFPLKSYHFHEYTDFSADEQKLLEGDWLRVRNFIHYLQTNYGDACKNQYPRISHELRERLMLIDTAPKWPHPPRFRFKRAFVTSILRKHLTSKKLETLKVKIEGYGDFDSTCFKLAKKYAGWTVEDLCRHFDIKASASFKAIAEPIIIHMFGGKSKKMRDVDFFYKTGYMGKSFVLTKKGGRTEDAKFFTIDFSEFKKEDAKFEDSQFYEFFSSAKFLVVVFEEPNSSAPLTQNRFLGFRTVVFTDEFIETKVRPVWNQIRYLIHENKLEDVPVLNKKGEQIINKNGQKRSAPNFPKSRDKDAAVFVRGTGRDSSDKSEEVNGIRMYRQQVWLRGDYFAKLLMADVHSFKRTGQKK